MSQLQPLWSMAVGLIPYALKWLRISPVARLVSLLYIPAITLPLIHAFRVQVKIKKSVKRNYDPTSIVRQ